MSEEFFELNASAYWNEKRSYSHTEIGDISDFIDSSAKASLGCLLDVGCGPGDDLKRLSQIEHSQLYGIDPSAAFVKIAKMQLGSTSKISKGVCENLPYTSGYFATIVSRFSLNHCNNINQSISEIWRCLSKGGIFICVIPHPSFYERNVDPTDSSLVRVAPFAGEVSFSYKKRALTDFLNDQFLAKFTLLKVREFFLDMRNDLPSALGFVARKIDA